MSREKSNKLHDEDKVETIEVTTIGDEKVKYIQTNISELEDSEKLICS
jgi:hypothetical protein